MNRLLIILLTLASCSLASPDSKCHKGGEYCLNHWDCCSNTCLSFLYQCSSIPSTDLEPSTPLHAPAYFSAPVSQSITPETVSYESLLDIIFKPLSFVSNILEGEVDSIKPRVDADDDADCDNKKEAKTEEDVISMTTVIPECLEIGSKCYFNDECCTKRCHGFLHQCVT